MSRGASALVLIVLVVLAVGAAMGFRMIADSANADGAVEPVSVSWPRIEVEQVTVRDLAETLEVAGTTRGDQHATLHAELTGTVRQVHVEIGDWVREGSVLVELIDEAQAAAYEKALAQYDLTAGEYAFAQLDYERTSRLYDSTTNRDFGVTELELRRTRQRRDSAQATKRAAAADVLTARDALRRTVVRAPFTGVISERFIDRGALVSPTTPLLRLDDLRRIRVELALSSRDLGRIDQRAPVERIRLATHAQPFTGRISAVSPSARRDGLFNVEVTLNEIGLDDIDFDNSAADWHEHLVPLSSESIFVNEVHHTNPLNNDDDDDGSRASATSLAQHHRILRGALPRNLVKAGVTARVSLPCETVRNAVVVPEAALGRTAADEFFVAVVERSRTLVDYFGPTEEALQETVRRIPVTPVRYVGRYAVLGQLAPDVDPTLDDDLDLLRTTDGRILPLAKGDWIVRGKQQELRSGDAVIVID